MERSRTLSFPGDLGATGGRGNARGGPSCTLAATPETPEAPHHPRGLLLPREGIPRGAFRAFKAHVPPPRQGCSSAQDVTLSLRPGLPGLISSPLGSIQPSFRHPSESLESIGPAPLSRLPATPHPTQESGPRLRFLLRSPAEDVGLTAGNQDTPGRTPESAGLQTDLQGTLRAWQNLVHVFLHPYVVPLPRGTVQRASESFLKPLLWKGLGVPFPSSPSDLLHTKGPLRAWVGVGMCPSDQAPGCQTKPANSSKALIKTQNTHHLLLRGTSSDTPFSPFLQLVMDLVVFELTVFSMQKQCF